MNAWERRASDDVLAGELPGKVCLPYMYSLIREPNCGHARCGDSYFAAEFSIGGKFLVAFHLGKN